MNHPLRPSAAPSRGHCQRTGRAGSAAAAWNRRLHAQLGFTLIDITLTLAVVGILVSVALPSYQAQLASARRSEAVTGLTQVQALQEQFRAHHGSYALQLSALKGAVQQGSHYGITLVAAHAQAYIVRARRLDGNTHGAGCSELTLSVQDGVATHGPSQRCWNR